MATIRKRGDKWEVQIRRKGHSTVTKSFTKKVLADKWATEKESEIDDGSYRDTRAANLAPLTELLDKYLSTITPAKEVSSYVPEKARIGTLKRHFKTTLASLCVQHVLDYVDQRLLLVSSDSIRRELQLLSDVVDSAQTIWGLHIVANPVQNAKRILRKLRKLKPGNRRERRLRPGEYELIRRAPHSKFTLINQIALFTIETGMRRSELANLNREHIDIGRRVLYVPKSKTDWQTGRKGRVVPLSEIAVSILKSLPARLDGSVFGLRPESISQAFERICEDCNITNLRFHDLRHECISRWFDSGKFSVAEIASMSGHSSWASLKRYTHPDPEKLANKMG